MMNGPVICNAPAAAATLITLRRLIFFASKFSSVMRFLQLFEYFRYRCNAQPAHSTAIALRSFREWTNLRLAAYVNLKPATPLGVRSAALFRDGTSRRASFMHQPLHQRCDREQH